MVVLEDIVVEVGQLGLWVQAVGLLVIFWIVTELITMYFNRKRRLLLEEIDKRLKRVETKLNKLDTKI